MIDLARRLLRRWRLWIRFQELRREGFAAAWRRHRLQVLILRTAPMWTAATGPIEVRVLTWRRDWVNQIWALKTYYHFAGVDYPLVIHDGGLLGWQVEALRSHFPNARFISSAEANARFPAELSRHGLPRSAEFRARNVLARKLFDYFLDSTADHIVSIDSDILFFRRPEKLIVPPGGLSVNRYNEDDGYWYSMAVDELDAEFGIGPLPKVNAGLWLVRRESIDFPTIEQLLEKLKLSTDSWLTEQTLHALVSAKYGLELLPSTYRCGGPPGVTPDLVCKHYPGKHRPLLYTEGMRHLLDSGLITALKASPG